MIRFSSRDINNSNYVFIKHRTFLMLIKFFLSIFVTTCLGVSTTKADECTDYLKYPIDDRIAAWVDTIKGASNERKLAIASLIEAACKNELPEFPRNEANKDVKKILPYLKSTSFRKTP